MQALGPRDPARNASTEDAPSKLQVGDCERSAVDTVGSHPDPISGAPYHNIDPALEQRLKAFYAPTNRRLFNFLQRDLGWGQ